MNIRMNNVITKFEHSILRKNELTDEEFSELLNINSSEGGGFFEIVNEGIKFKQYVGVIFLSSGKIIEILPKIYNGEDPNELLNARRFLTILFYEFFGLDRNASYSFARSKFDFEFPFIEVLVLLILDFIEKRIIKPGVYKHYIRNQINSKSLNGKLLLSQTLLKFPFQRDRFIIEKEILTPDVAINRILISLSEFILKRFKNSKVRDLAGKIILYLQSLGIHASKNVRKDLREIKLNRMNVHYQPVVQFAKFLFFGQSILGSEGVPFTFLYNMDELFEKFVAASLPECIFQKSTKIGEGFYLRPDIILPLSSEKWVIIDTKWKLLKNVDSMRNDRFQVISYIYVLAEREKKEIPLGIILYPDLSNLSHNKTVVWELSDSKKLMALGLGLKNLLLDESNNESIDRTVILLKKEIRGRILDAINEYTKWGVGEGRQR